MNPHIEEARRAHDQNREAWQRANEAAVSSGNVALRTAMLINGGAAIALLGFSGSVISGQKDYNLSVLISPLHWFAWGVAAATLAMGFGYVVNYANAGIANARIPVWEFPYLQETTASNVWKWIAIVFTVLAVITGIASLALFVYGMLEIKKAVFFVGMA